MYLQRKMELIALQLKDLVMMSKGQRPLSESKRKAEPVGALSNASMFSVASYNLWGLREQWDARVQQAATALLAPPTDMVFLQEVRSLNGTVASQAHVLAELLGLSHVAFRPVREDAAGAEGLAIISRWPLRLPELLPLAGTATSTDPNPRAALHAIVELSASHSCHVVVLHLTYDASSQCRMVLSLMDAIAARVAPDDCLVIAGDFNT